MIKIEVTGNNTSKKSGAGRDYTIQEAYAAIPTSKYPVRIEVFAPDQGPYPAGMYVLDPASFAVGQYGRLEVKPILTPAPKG